MRAHLSKLEAKLEALLQHVSEELATEVGREQNHLMLMQDQARPGIFGNLRPMSCYVHSTHKKNFGPCLSKGHQLSSRGQARSTTYYHQVMFPRWLQAPFIAWQRCGCAGGQDGADAAARAGRHRQALGAGEDAALLRARVLAPLTHGRYSSCAGA